MWLICPQDDKTWSEKIFWSLCVHRYQNQSFLITIVAAIGQGVKLVIVKNFLDKNPKNMKFWPKNKLQPYQLVLSHHLLSCLLQSSLKLLPIRVHLLKSFCKVSLVNLLTVNTNPEVAIPENGAAIDPPDALVYQNESVQDSLFQFKVPPPENP